MGENNWKICLYNVYLYLWIQSNLYYFMISLDTLEYVKKNKDTVPIQYTTEERLSSRTDDVVYGEINKKLSLFFCLKLGEIICLIYDFVWVLKGDKFRSKYVIVEYNSTLHKWVQFWCFFSEMSAGHIVDAKSIIFSLWSVVIFH